MEAYQQRVCDEALALQDQLIQLLTFQRSHFIPSLDPAEQERLYAQGKAMYDYYTILCRRISCFEKKGGLDRLLVGSKEG